LEQSQSPFQRGFTKGVSPLHASLLVEEVTRESRDKGTNCNIVFLDAKAAFDVVDHDHLLRRLYHAGVRDRHWLLFDSIHRNSKSCVKWMNRMSGPFIVQQGVKQCGVASTDLYKLYVDPLLHRLEDAGTGMIIGNICCSASACADDVCVCAVSHYETQHLITITEDFANSERYTLQPKKTEALLFKGRRTTANRTTEDPFLLYQSPITAVDTATHLGIKRSSTQSATNDSQVKHNITKARKTLYSLMTSG